MLDPSRLAEIAKGPHPAAVCTVVATKGSTPRKAGASMVVIADGSSAGAIEGTVGGGAVEHEVRRVALEVIATMQPRLVEIPLTTQLGMCCGGTMTFFIEALRQRPPCILLGAGHTAQALCKIATASGFDVSVADPREELLTRERFEDAVMLVDDYQPEDLAKLPFGPDTFVVVCSHDHQVDQQLVERALPLPSRFIALVGSQRKALRTRERCLNKGMDATLVDKLRCPAGLDIGAETPEEIAVSIVAEMILVRRQAHREQRKTRGAAIALAGARSQSSGAASSETQETA